ncbi:MAG: hypothetical protein JO255_04235 [Alphaproteobacteria bacterium]|nr:hypothetical protein [Alphaproteobacteria bacterium]
MDPVSVTLISAFVAGAATGLTKVGDKAVVEAYDALKHLIVAGYQSATELLRSIESVEADPKSKGRQAVLGEELQKAGALDDEKLVAAAQTVLKAAKASSPAIGIDWSEVEAASVKIDEIRAEAGSIGFRAARSKLGTVDLGKIHAGGGSSGN